MADSRPTKDMATCKCVNCRLRREEQKREKTMNDESVIYYKNSSKSCGDTRWYVVRRGTEAYNIYSRNSYGYYQPLYKLVQHDTDIGVWFDCGYSIDNIIELCEREGLEVPAQVLEDREIEERELAEIESMPRNDFQPP
jgi:hypothetical protein